MVHRQRLLPGGFIEDGAIQKRIANECHSLLADSTEGDHRSSSARFTKLCNFTADVSGCLIKKCFHLLGVAVLDSS
ncbi:unnamed protein product [Urochloa humidicola]